MSTPRDKQSFRERVSRDAEDVAGFFTTRIGTMVAAATIVLVGVFALTDWLL